MDKQSLLESNSPFGEIARQVEAGRGQDTPITTNKPEIEKCETCNGLGWVTIDVPVDDPKFGQSVGCPTCWPPRFKQLCWGSSGIPEDHRGETFANFKKRKGTEESLAAAREIANPESSVRLVILCGGTGNGKTHLGYSVAMSAIESGIAAWVIRAKDWLEDLKAAIAKDQRFDICEADMMRKGIERVPVLIIDELKWRTNFDEETIDDLICGRLVKGLRTLVTSNNSVEDLDNTFPRIVSRASDPRTGRVVFNRASDYRRGQ